MEEKLEYPTDQSEHLEIEKNKSNINIKTETN
jgi:hypothetical protein